MADALDTFWNGPSAGFDVTTRRIIFSFGRKLGEVVISVAPGQPVCDIAVMGNGMLQAATVDAKKLKAHDNIAPQLVFADIHQSSHGSTPVVQTATHRELPVWQIIDKTDHVVDDLSFQHAMKAAHAAMPTAAVAPGDHAVGFLVRSDVLNFYPLMAVTIPEELDSYKAGEGSTDDVIPLLPFQS